MSAHAMRGTVAVIAAAFLASVGDGVGASHAHRAPATVGAADASRNAVVQAAQRDPNAPLPPAEAAPAPGAITSRVSPLRDARGLHPGLSPVRARELAQARRLIRRVRAAAANATTDYDRDLFGSPWTDNQTATWGDDGCRTRENILRRDMRTVTFAPGGRQCEVRTGVLDDVYTATTISFRRERPSEVQIDHVIALAYGWAQGASRWSTEKRKQIANDPLNLLAVDGPTNQRKGDDGPAEWLPPNTSVHCGFAVRFAQVSIKYRLAVQPDDRRVMLTACGA